MPRLHGYRERMNLNLWDSFRPKDLIKPGTDGRGIRLFGDANIGDLMRTDMLEAGRIASDSTMVIMSMFARTNIDTESSPELRQAWKAWTNSTIAVLAVGSSTEPAGTRPVGVTHPIASLLGPRTLGNMCGAPTSDSCDDDVHDIAKAIYERCNNEPHPQGPPRGPYRTAAPVKQLAWESLTQERRQMWLLAAHAHPLFMPVIVPVRQFFDVTITSDPKALDALLRVLPERIAPCPLVWIHLLGLQTRDVA